MKIRTDFVTNSSSSSFVSVRINSPLLAKILKDASCSSIEVDGSRVSIEEEEWTNFYDVPSKLDDVVDCICGGLSNSGIETDLVDSLRQQNAEITGSIEYVSWTRTDTGYGEDEGRFYPSNFSEKQQQEIWEEIAEENECSVTSLSIEDWSDWVCGCSSEDGESYEYDKASGKDEYTSWFGLL